MPIQLDHLSFPVADKAAAARLLASILDVPWAPSGIGPFCPVYVNDGLTIDFDQADGPYPVLHCAFRVDDAGIDAIVARLSALGIAWRSTPHGPADRRINTSVQGGRNLYWNEPGGHVWEALTVRYDTPPRQG